MKTLSELARESLAVQDASALLGVAKSFVHVVESIRAITPNNTEWKRHPIIQVWVDKLASLTGTQLDWDSMSAYQHVENIAELNK